MPVETTHADYDANRAKWTRCRAAVEGQDAIHAGGQTYLPALTGQETADYDKYKARANWYNASGRTLQALMGLIFRKDEEEELPPSLEDWKEDITLGGQSLKEFAQEATEHVMTVGRHGILVDFPRTQSEGVTQAEAEANDLRPYLTSYTAESIINWKTDRVGSRTLLVRVVLMETFTEPGDDEFEDEEKERYRVLDLSPEVVEGELRYGAYRVRIFEELDGEAGFVESDSFNPMNNGSTLSEIPFIFLGPTGTMAEVQKPPLIDVVNVNVSHYKTTADYEHGCHFTGLPTPYVTGFESPEGDSVAIGSETFLEFNDADVSVGFLEFTGKGLGELSTNLERKEKLMAALGARMLMPEKSAAESGIAEQTRRSGENSSLAKIANMVSKGLKQALQWVADWAGGGDVEYALNTDYLPAAMSAQDVTAWMAAWQGGMPTDVFYFNLKRGEALPDGMTFEEFEQGIKDNIGTLPDGDTGE